MKIIKINNCAECPYYDFYTLYNDVADTYVCLKGKKPIDSHTFTVGLDCPLTDFKDDPTTTG